MAKTNWQRLGLPLLVGVAAGVGVGYVAQQLKNRVEPTVIPRPIDWDRARRVALRVSGWDQHPVTDRATREAEYLAFSKQSEVAIADYLGVALPVPIQSVVVVDRKEWLSANFATLALMLRPLEELYAKLYAQGRGSKYDGPVAGVQLGGMFGYLARRVLGQYELGLLSPEPKEQGTLYFVEPNIDRLQRQLGLSDEFRYWIALHEVTHVFEFEAHPWVRDYFSGLLNEFLHSMTRQLAEQGVGLGSLLQRLARGASFERHPLTWLMSAEERALFDKLQALMSLVEGYSDHVMNVLGERLLPSFKEIERQVAAKKSARSSLEEGLERLMGMDLKRAQYKEGERFVDSVVRERGLDFLNRVWEKPENLPSLAEIRAPTRWVRRLDGLQLEAGA
ncbi:zinc-dependent metalloprotease [soil metagenome]